VADVTAPFVPDWCGERLTLQPSQQQRTVLTCIDKPGHDPQAGHRSGTDPVIRWRTNRLDPDITDVWVERWRDWAGRTVAEREAAGLVT
jgi:hypothetical protein